MSAWWPFADPQRALARHRPVLSVTPGPCRRRVSGRRVSAAAASAAGDAGTTSQSMPAAASGLELFLEAADEYARVAAL